MEHPLVPAAVLVVRGIQLVVVGSAALMEYGDLDRANDLDLVPAYKEANLWRLRDELQSLAYRPSAVGPFMGREVVTIVTSFGVIDVLIERGRLEFDELNERCRVIEVHGIPVAVASRADAWRLRRRYKVAS